MTACGSSAHARCAADLARSSKDAPAAGCLVSTQTQGVPPEQNMSQHWASVSAHSEACSVGRPDAVVPGWQCMQAGHSSSIRHLWQYQPTRSHLHRITSELQCLQPHVLAGLYASGQTRAAEMIHLTMAHAAPANDPSRYSGGAAPGINSGRSAARTTTPARAAGRWAVMRAVCSGVPASSDLLDIMVAAMTAVTYCSARSGG